MRIVKFVSNVGYVDLIIDKIEECGRFDIYQVSKIIDGKKTPLYRQCFSKFDIQEIINNKYIYGTSGELEDDNERFT